MKILILEDEALVAMLLEEMLDEAGHETVGPVTTLSEAREIIAQGGFDAAILDVNLGNGERGYDIAEELDERGIPYGFASGYSKCSLDQRFADKPHLQKPFLYAELQELIGNHFHVFA